MQNKIGLALRLPRISVGKTQSQVAAKIGVHPSLINFIELGKRAVQPRPPQSLLEESSRDAPDSPLVALALQEAHRIAREAITADVSVRDLHRQTNSANR